VGRVKALIYCLLHPNARDAFMIRKVYGCRGKNQIVLYIGSVGYRHRLEPSRSEPSLHMIQCVFDIEPKERNCFFPATSPVRFIRSTTFFAAELILHYVRMLHRFFLLLFLLTGRFLWTSASIVTVQDVNQTAAVGIEEEMLFLVVYVSYMILVPGGIKHDIDVGDYSPYLVKIMNELASEVEVQLFDQSEASPMEVRVASSQSGTERQNGNSTESHTSAFQVELPTGIEQIQDMGFTSTPLLTDEGIFVRGPCPTQSGSEDRHRCEQVTASIRLGLVESMIPTPQVAEALIDAFEDALRTAILDGRLDELLLEFFPWTDLIILSGYHVSSTIAVQTTSPTISPQEAIEEGNEIVSVTLVVIACGLCGLLLVLALVVLATACMFRRPHQPKTTIADTGMMKMKKLERENSPIGRKNAITSTSPLIVILEIPTGMKLEGRKPEDEHVDCEYPHGTPSHKHYMPSEEWIEAHQESCSVSSSSSSTISALTMASVKSSKSSLASLREKRTSSISVASHGKDSVLVIPPAEGTTLPLPSVDTPSMKPQDSDSSSSSSSSVISAVTMASVKSSKSSLASLRENRTSSISVAYDGKDSILVIPPAEGTTLPLSSVDTPSLKPQDSDSSSSSSSSVISAVTMASVKSSKSSLSFLRKHQTTPDISAVHAGDDSVKTIPAAEDTIQTWPLEDAPSSAYEGDHFDDADAGFEYDVWSLSSKTYDSSASNARSAATADFLSTSSVRTASSTSTQLKSKMQSLGSPMGVEDFDAFEEAILASDWKTLATTGSKLYDRRSRRPSSVASTEPNGSTRSVYSVGSVESSMVFSDSTQAEAVEGDNILRTGEVEDDDTSVSSSIGSSSKSDASMTRQLLSMNAWQAVIDAAETSEFIQVIARGNWSSIVSTAAKYAVDDTIGGMEEEIRVVVQEENKEESDGTFLDVQF